MTNITYKRAAELALDCQNACNLSGVVHSFADACRAIWDEAHQTGKGTDWVNTHPIVRLFAEKIVELNGNYVQDVDNKYSDAYAYVKHIAEQA